jgi:YHS domain-containing protein
VAKGDAVIGNLEGRKLYFCSMSCLEKFRDQLENTEKQSIGGQK